MFPKDVCVPVPEGCDYVMLDGNGGIILADGIKFTNQLTFSWGDYPGPSGEPRIIPGIFISERERQESVSEKEK